MPVALTAVFLLDDITGGWSLMTSIFLFLQAGRVDATRVPFLPCLPVNNSISPSRPPVPTCSTATQDEHATPSPRAMPAGSPAAAWQMFTWHRWEPEMRREQQTSVKACVQQTHTHRSRIQLCWEACQTAHWAVYSAEHIHHKSTIPAFL